MLNRCRFTRPLWRLLSSALGRLLPTCTLLAAALLVLAPIPARADIDMALNTSNFVPGQASTLSVDGAITECGSSTGIMAASITLRFDPAKITLSSFRAPAGSSWSILAYNLDHAADGWAKAAMLSDLSGGQTASGPVLLFTVTPTDASVVVNDCITLKLSALESDMADQAYDSIYPSDPCGGPATPGIEPPAAPKDGGGGSSGPSPTTVSSPTRGDIDASGHIDIVDAVKAARFLHGLDTASSDEQLRADIAPLSSPYAGDGSVTADDARSVLRIGAGMDRPIDIAYTPYGLNAYATGSGRITLYWNGMPAASAYNVYRSTVSGGPYTLVASGVNSFSYPGSTMYMYTDTLGLVDGTTYYYVVKGALADGEESAPTEEASDTPNYGAVPWDTRNSYAILMAFRGAFPDEVLYNLRLVGPDGTVYDDTSYQPGNPDGTIQLGTNQAQLADGSTQTAPDDFGLSGTTTQGPQLDSVNLPIGKGPYRRVRTLQAYQGVRGRVYLPPASSVNIVPDSPGPSPVYTDTAYIYLGMTYLHQNVTNPGTQTDDEVDAGLQWSPKYQNWAPFMIIKGSAVAPTSFGLKHPATMQPIVNLPQGQPRFTPNQTLTVTYYSSGTAANTPQKLSLLVIGDTGFPYPIALRSLGAPSPVRSSLANVRAKRIHAIAQKDFGVRTTGSSISDVQWTAGELLLPTGIWTPWTTYDTNEDGSFEGLSHEAYINWDPDYLHPYETEYDISISIP